MNRKSITERLGVNKYELDEGHPHIEVFEEACRKACPEMWCLYVCPADVYKEVNGHVVVDWAGCLECGTCRVACPSEEGLYWVYPRGGFGVVYRSG